MSDTGPIHGPDQALGPSTITSLPCASGLGPGGLVPYRPAPCTLGLGFGTPATPPPTGIGLQGPGTTPSYLLHARIGSWGTSTAPSWHPTLGFGPIGPELPPLSPARWDPGLPIGLKIWQYGTGITAPPLPISQTHGEPCRPNDNAMGWI